MGAAVSGQGARDMNGDLNQLILAGWVPAQIIAVYWLFIKTCGFVILTYYILGLLKDQSKIE